MPTKIELTADTLIVHVEGADRVWALKSRLEIPLTNVIGARPADEEARRSPESSRRVKRSRA